MIAPFSLSYPPVAPCRRRDRPPQSSRRKPAAVACSRDGRRVAVSDLWAGTLTLLEVRAPTLQPAGTVSVGALPRGLVFTPDGDSLYVALAGAHEVVQIDWQTRQVL